MARDPFEFVEDAPLFIVPRVLDALRAYRAAPRLDGVPAAELDGLLDRLLAGIERHPTKFWVLKQFQKSLLAVDNQDAEERERFRHALERIMDIVGIEDSDGFLSRR